ncbi:hypothetical protein SAMN02745227_01424 [Anaerobranca californiensis DSM 14826]|jgi:hypothetical protein|uniref:YvlB/LiaX N-terminal domain-containing protein n=1 Tax=Anaerobranca californiensis DSM 14826 TaxID=1120989 RepID=A0A1M6PEG0_9FIRM|nr:hypothetical protein [Anaerobranca californiensis]SHK06272.1 hypothetical protein SAMN02745227_01424 [Anaerobranca californiensis DSM 14826]
MTFFQKNFSLPFGGKVKLSIDKGKLAVWGWEKASCKLEVDGEKSKIGHETHEGELELDIEGGNKGITLYVPKHCNLMIDGSYVDGEIGNIDGKVVVDNGSGNFKFSNIKGDGNIDIEKGNIEFENIRGKWFIDQGFGDISGFNLNGEIKLEMGKGDVELIRLNGDCILENGKGQVVIKDSEGTFHLDLGSGSLALDNCNFQKLTVEGKGNAEVNLPSDYYGVWRFFMTGDLNFAIPVVAHLNFKIDCNHLDNKLPGLKLCKKEGFYTGSLGNRGRGSLYIEGAKTVSIIKGNSNVVIDTETEKTDEETLRILQMLKDGILTLEQANELLETMESSGGEFDE